VSDSRGIEEVVKESRNQRHFFLVLKAVAEDVEDCEVEVVVG